MASAVLLSYLPGLSLSLVLRSLSSVEALETVVLTEDAEQPGQYAGSTELADVTVAASVVSGANVVLDSFAQIGPDEGVYRVGLIQSSGGGGGGGGDGDATLANQQAMIAQLSALHVALAGGGVGYSGAVADSGDITLVLGDDYRDEIDHVVPLPVDDPGGALFALLTDDDVNLVIFGAGTDKNPNLIVGTIDKNEIAANTPAAGKTLIPIQIAAAGIDPTVNMSTRYGYRIRLKYVDGETVRLRSVLGGWLTVEPEYAVSP